jgi:hypothetical protein
VSPVHVALINLRRNVASTDVDQRRGGYGLHNSLVITTDGLTLVFANARGEPFSAGPVERIRLEGTDLILQPPGDVFACHEDHRWVLRRGGSFSRMDCPHPVFVCFESRDGATSRTFGPYRAASAVDGIVYVDSRIAAFCDQQNRDWYSYELGTHWKAVVISPAEK